MSPDVPPAHSPAVAEMAERFGADLHALWLAAGQVPCRQISRDLEGRGAFYSKSTIADVLRGVRLPKHDLLRDLVGYLGGDVAEWDARLTAIRTAQAGRHLDGDRQAAAPVADGRPAVPRQLPLPCTSFTGREAQLARLDEIFAPGDHGRSRRDPAVAAVIGPGGVGKTSLALRWAHQHAGRFPDGQLYVDLRGFGPEPPVPAAAVVKRFLVALGVPATAQPPDADTQVALYRSLLADRRILVVLDNAAHSDHVLPLLPGGARCAVLVTSRTMLGALTVRGASPVPLDVLSDAEARQFLSSRLGRRRVAELREEALATLLLRCGGLPLALGIVAARAGTRPDRPLAELTAELDEDTTRLDALSVGEVDGDLRRVLSWSYEALPVPAARAFRLLGLAPGADVGLPATAALLGLDRAATRGLLRQLVAAHLLQERSGRYRMHDLVRLFAAELSAGVDPPAQRSAAVAGICGWYLRHADRADRVLAPNRRHVLAEDAGTGLDLVITGHDEAMDWYDSEHGNLAAAAHAAAAAGHHEPAWQLPLAAFGYYRLSQNWREWFDLQQVALVAARAVRSETAEAWVLNALGIAHTILQRDADAATAFEQSLAIRRRAGDRVGEGQVLNNLGELSRRMGRYREAIDYALADHRICLELDDKYGDTICLNNLGKALLCAHEAEGALAAQLRALELCHEIDELHAVAEIHHDLGETYRRLDRPHEAVRHYQAAVDNGESIGDLLTTTWALLGMGDVAAELGDHDVATDCATRAADLITTLSGTGATDALGTRLDALRRRAATTAAEPPGVAWMEAGRATRPSR